MTPFFTSKCPYHGDTDFLYMEITLSTDAAGVPDQTDGLDQCVQCWSDEEEAHAEWASSGYPEDKY